MGAGSNSTSPQTMKNPHELYQLVLDIFQADLGTYTRPDNSVVPAIALVPPEPQGNFYVSGVEVVIREPEDDPHLLLGGRYISNERFLVVSFIQHDTNESLYQIRNKILTKLLPEFPGGNLTHLAPNGDVLEQVNVRLYAPEVLEIER